MGWPAKLARYVKTELKPRAVILCNTEIKPLATFVINKVSVWAITSVLLKLTAVKNTIKLIATIKKYLRLILLGILVIGFLMMIAIVDRYWLNVSSSIGAKFSGCSCDSAPDTSDVRTEPKPQNPDAIVPQAKRSKFQTLPDTGIEKEPEAEPIQKKVHVLGESADISWKVVLIQNGKKGKQIQPETIDRWKAELQLMRYRCNSYYNERVEVNCWSDEHYCDVSFVSTVAEKEYRMFFRSEVSANGYDKIVDWKVYSVKSGVIGQMGIEARSQLIDQIIAARPNCNPFSTK